MFEKMRPSITQDNNWFGCLLAFQICPAPAFFRPFNRPKSRPKIQQTMEEWRGTQHQYFIKNTIEIGNYFVVLQSKGPTFSVNDCHMHNIFASSHHKIMVIWCMWKNGAERRTEMIEEAIGLPQNSLCIAFQQTIDQSILQFSYNSSIFEPKN